MRKTAEVRGFQRIVRDQSVQHCNNLACFVQTTLSKNMDPRIDLKIDSQIFLRLEDMSLSQSPEAHEFNVVVVYFKQELVNRFA